LRVLFEGFVLRFCFKGLFAGVCFRVCCLRVLFEGFVLRFCFKVNPRAQTRPQGRRREQSESSQTCAPGEKGFVLEFCFRVLFKVCF